MPDPAPNRCSQSTLRAYFSWFVSPTLARGAAGPGRRIIRSLITLPVATAGGIAVRLCYGPYSRIIAAQPVSATEADPRA